MVSLSKVHDTKDFWFLTTDPSKHFSYVRYNLYLKASKYFFGYSELEFVGRVVSEKGLQISRTKIQSVLEFPLPTVSKQLKSFLGTANYLRDFVRDYSTISQPLHQLL